ncbi:coenzyme F420 biosynthesis-associated protein [Amycolatopsis sp. WAC 04182]|uniref:zinc-dependent metalloprotease n=1 Tax=Amycolatopsis sp. WAC 04182 TaxID=2203198 RepID=UPI000F7770EB|nr:zinc-dependent metalloprotease [Amycolatopsis sp. WAC 04182]RSN53446.1 coenzyme F420 biosynthesis-associated protein [Amycolatopsis sp. WAC 04182]
MVDWSLAASTGALLVRGGPVVDREEAEEAVADLRDLTGEAEGHVRELTGLGLDLPLLPAEVVDRPGWVRSAAAGLDALTGRALPEAQGGPLAPVLAGGAGVQTGLVLAFLASRVLGQYDPFGGPDRAGRLVLVAPNVVAAQRAMDVSGHDFRLWVCLHECTHRLQFTAVTWLRDYFADEVERLIGGLAGRDADGLSDLVGRLPDTIKQIGKGKAGGAGLAELLQSPSERAVFDRLLALSTLLEGHADFVMDAVGPQVVPSVELIRSRFTARRKGGGLIDRVLRSLLGVDAKLRQYEQGAKFTKHVVDAVGMDGFNAVWTSPNTLPTRAEISDPAAWVRRLHG